MSTIGESTTEIREDIPLKPGAKQTKCFAFPEECFGGSKFINISFAVISAAVTVALLIQIYYGDYQVAPHGSVATDSRECSEIGTSILKNGGNAVDASIASTFCLSVTKPHLTGLDAQGQILIYNHRLRLDPDVIDFSAIQRQSTELPRLVLGLGYIHHQYGVLPWKELVMPSADLARNGFLVSKSLALANTQAHNLYGTLAAGEILTLKTLGNTLERIANIPQEELEKIFREDNLPLQSQAIKTNFNGYNIYVPSSPSIGPALLVNLQHIAQMNYSLNDLSKPLFFTSLASVTEAVYKTLDLARTFHNGTSSNVAVMDTNEQYVSLITGMYAPFGSKEKTVGGYILDIPVDPPQPTFRIPLIITNSQFVCGRRLIFAANNVETATQLIVLLLVGHKNATDTIESPRFYLINQKNLGLEGSHIPFFHDEQLQPMEKIWKLVEVKEPYDSSNIVEKIGDYLNSHSDSREGGISSRF